MTVQETMTKEQILYKNCVNYTGNEKELTFEEFLKELEHPDTVPFIISMEEYKNQQLSAERERAGKLVEAVQSFVQASDDFNIGYINRNGEITRCGIAALSVAFNDAEKRLRIALTEYNKP